MPIDYSEYPPNWHSEIRPAVLERANNCCEFCSTPNYKVGFWVYTKGKEQPDFVSADVVAADIYNMGVPLEKKPLKIILTIAHLDHDKTNHEVKLERLRALCQRCHLNYDRVRHRLNFRNNRWKRMGLQDMYPDYKM